jgi:hypothetical protein
MWVGLTMVTLARFRPAGIERRLEARGQCLELHLLESSALQRRTVSPVRRSLLSPIRSWAFAHRRKAID